MQKLLSFIPPQLFVIATGVFLLGMGIIAMGYQLSLNHTKADLKTANDTLIVVRADLTTCKGNVATLQAAITEQNVEIEKLGSKCAVANAAADARAKAVLAKPIKTTPITAPKDMDLWLTNTVTH